MQPYRRSRKFAPKTKTGCKTCKIRRVKCDEQSPACRRCCSTGRKCDGYDILCVSPIVNRPIPQLMDEVEERRLFHTFRTITSSHFSGDSSSAFWSRLVLQACHVDSSVRFAAIALASLHEGFISQHHTGDQNEKISLQHYGKAVGITRKALSVRNQPVVVTLMSCAMFSCFESFRGQMANAVMHVRSGLDILLSHVKTIDSITLRSIFLIFSRIGFQASYFVDHTNHAQVVEQLRSLSASQVDLAPTLENMQASLYSCLNGSMFSGQQEDYGVELTSLGLNYHMTRCAQLIISGSNAPGFLRGRGKAISNLERWQNVFKDFLHAQNAQEKAVHAGALTLLKLHHLVAMMMLSPEHNSSMAANFQQIIGWSKFLLVGKSALPTFLPDVGIVAPLFFVASKGPNATLRGQAKELLAFEHRREGIWDSEVAIRILIEQSTVRN